MKVKINCFAVIDTGMGILEIKRRKYSKHFHRG
jgi:hypothetical protein